MSTEAATLPFREAVDAEALEAWAGANVPELGNGPLQQSLLAGGSSNIVLRIDRGGRPMILRRPPLALRPDSVKVISREARALEALKGSAVPCPGFEAYCGDAAVIGSPFYVMSLVEGFLGYPFDQLPAPYDRPGEPKRQIAFALVDAIAELAKVDYRAVGLEGFGKPEGFLERQVER